MTKSKYAKETWLDLPPTKEESDARVRSVESSLSRYLKSLCEFDLVSNEEEKLLVKEANSKSKNSQEARDKMILSNIRLVIKCAMQFKKCHVTPIETQDFAEYGVLGLIKAIDRYNPNHESESVFSTYAVPYIRAELFKAYRSGRIIRIPFHRHDLMHSLIQLKKEYLLKEEDLTDDIILEKLGCTKNMLGKIKGHLKDDVVHLEELGAFNSSVDTGDGWESFIEDKDAIMPLDKVIKDSTMDYLTEVMSEVLSNREQMVLWNVYFTPEPLMLTEICKFMGISRERVRQLKVTALRKMKNHFREEYLGYSSEDVILELTSNKDFKSNDEGLGVDHFNFFFG